MDGKTSVANSMGQFRSGSRNGGPLRATRGKVGDFAGWSLIRKFHPTPENLFHPPLESAMLLSEKKVVKGVRRKSWRVGARVSAELKDPLIAMAEQRGGTLTDEIELAIRAHLKTAVPDSYIPEKMELKAYDKALIKMKRTNGARYTVLAREYGITVRQVKSICTGQ